MIIKGDCKITLEEVEEKGSKGKGSLAAVGNKHYHPTFSTTVLHLSLTCYSFPFEIIQLFAVKDKYYLLVL